MLSILWGCAHQPEAPNVLFILADDFGYSDLSVMGSSYYETPNIDKIANEGTLFTNGYAGCQVCSPSRASIMTGKFPPRHGITDWIGAASGTAWRARGTNNKLLPSHYEHTLKHEYLTLPEAMKEGGYSTFFAGKWHLGGKGSYPEDHGFDINVGGWDSGSPRGGYFAPFKNPKLEDRQDGENLSMRLAQETIDFMKNNKDTKFFAFLSFYAVHGPIQTRQEKWQKYRDKAEQNGIAENGFRMGERLPERTVQDNPVYAGLVESMDDAVGLVLNALKELGLDKNTIVCFTSDNGGVIAGDAYSTSNAPLRGGKGQPYEGGIREPYFIKVPWLNKVKKVDTPVSGTDFYPTLLDLAGLPLRPNEHQDGMSIVPLLKGDKLPGRPLIWHYPHYGNQGGAPVSIIRQGEWKLIHHYEKDKAELYHLKSDLSESENVASQHPKRVQEMNDTLFAYLNEVGAEFPQKDPEFDAALAKETFQQIRNKQMLRREKQRKDFLSKDYDPQNNWWGSQARD